MSVTSLIQPHLNICELCSILVVLARYGCGERLTSPAVLRATTWPKLGNAWALAEENDNLGTFFLRAFKRFKENGLH